MTGIESTSKLYAISNPQTTTKVQDIEAEKENIVLFVGRLVFQKRLDRLFRIWNRIKYKKDWKLIIVGDGPDRGFYETLCQKWNVDKVNFVGQCDPASYYQKAKILCMTSSLEGTPCVIQEAIQHNVIPIAYKSFESIDDIITNGKDGFTIRPFSVRDYSKTLERLMNDTSYRESIFANIRERDIRNIHSIDGIVKQWRELFKSIN